MGEAIEDLTGAVATGRWMTDILDRDYFWNERLLKANQDFLIACGVARFALDKDFERNGIVGQLAYSISGTAVIDGHRILLIRNPWGCFEWNEPWSKFSNRSFHVF
jgi:hypothetical protein